MGELLQRFSGMRAGLSTRQEFCEGLVRVGAGLPTQRVGGFFFLSQGGCKSLGGVRSDLSLELPEFGRRQRSEVGLHPCHLGGDFLFELSSFVRGHRSEEGSHLFHLCFGGFRWSRAWTVSGIMSFLAALIARSSYVGSVLSP